MKWWVGWVWGPIRAKAKCQSFVYLSCYFVCTTKKTANRPNLLILLNFLVSCLFCCCWKNPNLLKNDNDVGACTKILVNVNMLGGRSGELSVGQAQAVQDM